MIFVLFLFLQLLNLKLLPNKRSKKIGIYLSLGNNKVIDIFQQACDIIRYVLKPILKDTAINVNSALIQNMIDFILFVKIPHHPLIGCLRAF